MTLPTDQTSSEQRAKRFKKAKHYDLLKPQAKLIGICLPAVIPSWQSHTDIPLFWGKGKHQEADRDLRAADNKLSGFILTLPIKIKWLAEEILKKDYLETQEAKTTDCRDK